MIPDAGLPEKKIVSKFAITVEPPVILDARILGARAEHFAWMGQPQAVAEALAACRLPALRDLGLPRTRSHRAG